MTPPAKVGNLDKKRHIVILDKVKNLFSASDLRTEEILRIRSG
jgi:hypothetical protein